MAISRASMQQQLKGNRVKKKNIGGIISMLISQEQKKKKKTGSEAMKAKAMTAADRMSGGGKMDKSKRTRSIDGIASKGKTRATQR